MRRPSYKSIEEFGEHLSELTNSFVVINIQHMNFKDFLFYHYSKYQDDLDDDIEYAKRELSDVFYGGDPKFNENDRAICRDGYEGIGKDSIKNDYMLLFMRSMLTYINDFVPKYDIVFQDFFMTAKIIKEEDYENHYHIKCEAERNISNQEILENEDLLEKLKRREEIKNLVERTFSRGFYISDNKAQSLIFSPT